jgi:hypothetical protein
VTKKDFELIAGVLRVNALAWKGSVGASAVRDVASDMAAELARTNARFDRERFLTACEVAP